MNSSNTARFIVVVFGKSRKWFFSQEEKIFLLKCYYETKSYKTVRNQFQEVYPDENVIPDSSIQRLVKKFKETGTVRDLPGCGRKTKQIEEMKDAVKTRLEAKPIISSRWLATQLSTSHTTTYRMMRRIFSY